jgi:hypothetical protein
MSTVAPRSASAGDPPRYLISPLLAQAGVPHLFTTRHFPGVRAPRDGGGPFDARAMPTLAEFGLAAQPAAFARQVHAADVVTAEQSGPAGHADVLTTSRRQLPLAISTADCLPIVLYDPVHWRLAVAHAGWRGTARSAARAAADALAARGGAPETFVGAIGPSIGPCCYEVDEPVIEEFARAFPERWRAWVTERGAGKWMLDLWRANEDQLETAGMHPSSIDNLRLCTACRTDLLFSYRRGRGQGRLVAVAAIP